MKGATQKNTEPNHILCLENLTKRFGGLEVLNDISLAIPPGKIYGLIGPNGAGKTTVFNLITGLLPPSNGNIIFDGTALKGIKPHRIAKLGISRTFQNIRVFKEMTLLENVVVGMHDKLSYGLPALLYGSDSYKRKEKQALEQAYELLSWVNLAHKADHIADSLPYAEQRKLELARALATEPKLLLLDEPVAGMNPTETDELMSEILQVRDKGYSILLIEHDMRFVMGICDRIAVLNFGKLIAEGEPDQIKRHPQVIEAYLGMEHG